ncbi:secreted RxLR effector protein 161-like [Vitis vinifera]|uniref:secreted RxLR effector protein 161-like n=1 Tax=Vitis vinifera TaxID=29760 RepID=UPI0028831C0E|nr:secreted RxLR effector protein 161-like [Vitis vinifera]
MEIDYAIRKYEPHKIIDTSILDEILLYERWEKSNRLSVMYIKTKNSVGIHGSIEQHENVRELLKAIDKQFIASDKALARTLIKKFTSLKLTVGSLMYAQVCTRPDIAFAVRMLGRYQSNPGLDHWRAAKKVMRYRTKDYKFMYRRTSNLEVVGYSNSNFAGCVDSRKVTSGCISILAGGAISWRSIKQTLTTTSTMKVEFISCFEATLHGV